MLSHINPQGGIVIYHFTAQMLITGINMPYILFPLQSLIYSQFVYSICLVDEDTNAHTETYKEAVQYPVFLSPPTVICIKPTCCQSQPSTACFFLFSCRLPFI